MRLYVYIAAIRVYRVVGDVGMVMALQTVKVCMSGTPYSFHHTASFCLLVCATERIWHEAQRHRRLFAFV